MLADVTVSTAVDLVDGDVDSIAELIANPGPDNKISLREAIQAANNFPDSDRITFSTAPAHGLNGATIALHLGELSIFTSMTIDASMLSQGLTIDAGHGGDEMPGTGDGFRIFNIQDFSGTAEVELVGLTLTGGDTPVPIAPGVPGDVAGGAIRSTGASLTIHDCTISDDASGSTGGGLYVLSNEGSATIEHSKFDSNEICAIFALAV